MRSTKKYLKIKFHTYIHIFIYTTILSVFGFGYIESNVQIKDRNVLNIGSRLELMIDSFLIEDYNGNIKYILHNPQPQNVAIIHDSPWEDGTGTYHTIFKDNEIYRMYYISQKKYVCYAESNDGINFIKPELGIIEFNGSKANNIIWEGGPVSHNLTPFKDSNPDCQPEHQYKAVGGLGPGLFILTSADGIHWSKLVDNPVITDGWFDSQNVAFWDNQVNIYRVYYRDWHRQHPPQKLRGIMTDRVYRGIKTSTSPDFINWTSGQWLEFTNVHDNDTLLKETHLYTNSIKPYFRAPHIYIGFPVRYVERPFGESSRQLPNAEKHEKRMRNIQRENAQTDGLIITSRNGKKFNYWNESFLRPGLRNNNWVYGNNYIAWQLVETLSDEPGNFPELSIYATESVGTEFPHQLKRYTLRMDGFISLNAPLSGGEIITKPIRFEGNQLILNYSTSASGSILVEIQNTDGKPIEGFSMLDCDEIYGDQLERIVTWQSKKELSDLQNKIIRIRIFLKDADLYSFKFEANHNSK